MRITCIVLTGLITLTGCASSGSGNGSQIADRFAAADSNGDGVLTPIETPSRLDFDAADVNGDEELTLEEVTAYTASLRG